jgi:hypothetical protein
MQHAHPLPPPGGAAPPPSPLEHSAILGALWPCLDTDDRRALRVCCTTMRQAVDAHASCLEGRCDAPVLSDAACARLHGVRTMTLRSVACLRRMLVALNQQPAPGAFPRLQSLRLRLEVGGNTHGTRHTCTCPMRA